MKNKEVRIISLLVLDTIFFLLEATIGYSVHSLALIADSFHMLNDIISLIIALWAVRVKNTKPADGKYTYGWQRAEILGALINAVFLLALCFTIVMDALQRFFEPQVINNPKLILIVGVAGLVSNGIGLVLFHEHGHSHSHGGADEIHDDDETLIQGTDNINFNGNGSVSIYEHGHSHTGSSTNVYDYLPDTVVDRYNENSPLIKTALLNNHDHDHGSNGHSHSHGDHDHNNGHHEDVPKTTKKRKSMNMEGVFLHVLGDALGNIGVIITALIIWKTEYTWRYLADPATSLIITLIIFSSALPLCRKSSKILLQATPPYINSNLIVENIINLPLVKSVHDFHVWNLNEEILIATLHLELADNCYTPAPSVNTTNDINNNNNNEIYQEVGKNTNQIDKVVFLRAVSQVRSVLHKFGIHSVTIQPEFEDGAKPLNKKASAYGKTNFSNCLVDDIVKCDTDRCK
ncbi:cation efflux protein [Scheffersomyces amazonensis]|uniref:cation efflux protein n=1 Tax=Scheffersomyces amazonensis TaxID=1078765 RepID=UPI00315D09B2